MGLTFAIDCVHVISANIWATKYIRSINSFKAKPTPLQYEWYQRRPSVHFSHLLEQSNVTVAALADQRSAATATMVRRTPTMAQSWGEEGNKMKEWPYLCVDDKPITTCVVRGLRFKLHAETCAR